MEFEFTPVESIDKVPEQFRGLYTQGEDGKFVVNETYKGVAEAVTGLSRNLKEMRQGLKNKHIDLTPLADWGNHPKAIREAFEAKLAELEAAKGTPGADVAKQIEGVKAAMAQAHTKDIEKHTQRSQALQNQLYGLLVENSATAAVAEMKGVPELLLPFVKNQVKVVEEDGQFKVYVMDPNGEVRYGHTGSPMSIKELVAEMKANEKFGRLFESEAPAGGGMPPRSGSTPPRTPGKVMTANEKIAAGLNKGQFRARGR